MAALTRSVFAGLIYFGLLGIVSVNGDNGCNYTACTQQFGRLDSEIPDCVHKSHLLTCLEDMAAQSRCADDKQNASKVLHRYVHGFTLLENTMCRNNLIFKGYKTKKQCWMLAVQCSQIFHFADPKTKKIGNYCKERYWVVDQCKNLENIDLHDQCKELHGNLLDAMFQESPCKGCAVAFQMIVLGLGILLTIVWNHIAINSYRIVTCFLSCIVSLTKCEDCNIGKCPDPIRTIPECSNTLIIDCVSDVFSSCPAGINIGHMLKANELTREAICRDGKLHDEMRKHTECWYFAFKCASALAFNSEFKDPEECEIRKRKLDECKTNPSPPISCIEIHEQFLELAYETSTCEGATIIAVHMLLSSAQRFSCYHGNQTKSIYSPRKVCLIEAKGAPTKKKCDFDKCKKFMEERPTCKEDESEAEQCLQGLHEECPHDAKIEYFLEKHKLIHHALCKSMKSGGTGPKFDAQADCWAKTEECLSKLVTPKSMLGGKICGAKKLNNDQCKLREDVEWHCREMHVTFLEHAFQESQCCACNIKINIAIIIATIFGMLFQLNYY
uniref:GDNF/GAS1 domain-containing protein n=1 Tax=Strigamia maritima TaxID=126957 RepID=T1IW98_STRMM